MSHCPTGKGWHLLATLPGFLLSPSAHLGIPKMGQLVPELRLFANQNHCGLSSVVCPRHVGLIHYTYKWRFYLDTSLEPSIELFSTRNVIVCFI